MASMEACWGNKTSRWKLSHLLLWTILMEQDFAIHLISFFLLGGWNPTASLTNLKYSFNELDTMTLKLPERTEPQLGNKYTIWKNSVWIEQHGELELRQHCGPGKVGTALQTLILIYNIRRLGEVISDIPGSRLVISGSSVPQSLPSTQRTHRKTCSVVTEDVESTGTCT